MQHIRTHIEGSLGHIQLNRPQRLNALSHNMITNLHKALLQFAHDAQIQCVALTACAGRAFCAGGDVVEVHAKGRNDPDLARRYFFNEYRLNHLIAHYPKPIVSLMDGLTLGGGVGLGCHASHRCVTEQAKLGMPEVAIGFVPDVGGSYLLSRAPTSLGLYLGLTGTLMSPEDAVYCGFADYIIASCQQDEILRPLQKGRPPADVLKSLCNRDPNTTTKSTLKQIQIEIDAIFSARSALDCLSRLLKTTPPHNHWQKSALDAIECGSATSIALSFELITGAKNLDLTQCLTREYRAASRLMEMSDFYEGVRAALIDKDQSPEWIPSSLAQVDPISIKSMLDPLANDLHFRR